MPKKKGGAERASQAAISSAALPFHFYFCDSISVEGSILLVAIQTADVSVHLRRFAPVYNQNIFAV